MSEDTNVSEAWHYTTGLGLLNIIQSNRLWASSAAFMNDADEIRTGKRALNDAAKRREPPLEGWQERQLDMLDVLGEGQPDNVFLLSASANGDALTLWRSYGQGTEAEYAIELDPAVELLPIEQNEASTHPYPPPNWGPDIIDYDDGEPIFGPDPDEPFTWGGQWGAVEYLRDGSNWASEELERILASLRRPQPDKLSTVLLMDYFTDIDPTVLSKNAGFEDEREVRMTWTVYPWWKFVLYRSSRFGLTPYIEVGAPNQIEHSELEEERNFLKPNRIGSLPLKSVRIGPTRSSPSAERALRTLLDSYGYGKVDIYMSSAPYR